jgi:hypothetical protein
LLRFGARAAGRRARDGGPEAAAGVHSSATAAMSESPTAVAVIGGLSVSDDPTAGVANDSTPDMPESPSLVPDGSALARYYADPDPTAQLQVVELKSLIRIRNDPETYPSFECSDDALPQKMRGKAVDTESRVKKGAGGQRNLRFVPAEEDTRVEIPYGERDGKGYVDFWMGIANEPSPMYQIVALVEQNEAGPFDVTWVIEPVPPPPQQPDPPAGESPAGTSPASGGEKKKTKKKAKGDKTPKKGPETPKGSPPKKKAAKKDT